MHQLMSASSTGFLIAQPFSTYKGTFLHQLKAEYQGYGISDIVSMRIEYYSIELSSMMKVIQNICLEL